MLRPFALAVSILLCGMRYSLSGVYSRLLQFSKVICQLLSRRNSRPYG